MRFTKHYLLIMLLLSVSSCMQTENSNSLDKDTYSVVGGAFGAARAILAQNCANCHIYHTLTEDQLVAGGVLVKGSPTASKIYSRLIGSVGGVGQKNMPTGGTLSAGEVATIEAWIQQAN